MTNCRMTNATARCALEAHEVVVVRVGALLGGRQLSLQLLHAVAVVQQLLVVALDLARPAMTNVDQVIPSALYAVLRNLCCASCRGIIQQRLSYNSSSLCTRHATQLTVLGLGRYGLMQS